MSMRGALAARGGPIPHPMGLYPSGPPPVSMRGALSARGFSAEPSLRGAPSTRGWSAPPPVGLIPSGPVPMRGALSARGFSAEHSLRGAPAIRGAAPAPVGLTSSGPGPVPMRGALSARGFPAPATRGAAGPSAVKSFAEDCEVQAHDQDAVVKGAAGNDSDKTSERYQTVGPSPTGPAPSPMRGALSGRGFPGVHPLCGTPVARGGAVPPPVGLSPSGPGPVPIRGGLSTRGFPVPTAGGWSAPPPVGLSPSGPGPAPIRGALSARGSLAGHSMRGAPAARGGAVPQPTGLSPIGSSNLYGDQGEENMKQPPPTKPVPPVKPVDTFFAEDSKEHSNGGHSVPHRDAVVKGAGEGDSDKTSERYQPMRPSGHEPSSVPMRGSFSGRVGLRVALAARGAVHQPVTPRPATTTPLPTRPSSETSSVSTRGAITSRRRVVPPPKSRPPGGLHPMEIRVALLNARGFPGKDIMSGSRSKEGGGGSPITGLSGHRGEEGVKQPPSTEPVPPVKSFAEDCKPQAQEAQFPYDQEAVVKGAAGNDSDKTSERHQVVGPSPTGHAPAPMRGALSARGLPGVHPLCGTPVARGGPGPHPMGPPSSGPVPMRGALSTRGFPVEQSPHGAPAIRGGPGPHPVGLCPPGPGPVPMRGAISARGFPGAPAGLTPSGPAPVPMRGSPSGRGFPVNQRGAPVARGLEAARGWPAPPPVGLIPTGPGHVPMRGAMPTRGFPVQHSIRGIPATRGGGYGVSQGSTSELHGQQGEGNMQGADVISFNCDG
uniref:WH2 domain-containing protein n=1 Tax=Steinernema glaseri TaxID=37863 RepID=A0A1I7YXK7_9BILA